MDALSDPRAFLSNQEKRAAQLKAIGIDESDISTEGVIKSSKVKQASSVVPSVVPGLTLPTKKEEKKEEEFKFEPITPDTLKQEKSFVKLTKKHSKELEGLRKKHLKERAMVQKTQCTAIEKLVKSKGK